jgi:hypothetical protein
MEKYKYRVALPAPALYGQFNHLDDIDIVLNALLLFGFDDIFEVARAAEIVSDRTRALMEEDAELPRPLISSACPAVLRLIRIRFPGLIKSLLPLKAPIELAARMALEKAQAARPDLKRDEIGIIFISPCAAKVTATRSALGSESSEVNAVFAIKDVYPHLLPLMKRITDSDDGQASAAISAGRMGVSWCGSGGESTALLSENYLAADGIENVIKVLEDLEDEKLGELDYIELNACSAGCVGGILTVENAYIALARIKKLRRFMPVSMNHYLKDMQTHVEWETGVKPVPVLKLSDDYNEAIEKMNLMNKLTEDLPGLDCGSCGAPTCEALAEDVARGFANENDCIFKLRDHIQSLIQDMEKLEDYIPPPFRTQKNSFHEGGDVSKS